MADAKVLFRHPDSNVRALPAKPLEFKDPKGESHFFVPDVIDGKVIYTVPINFARRMIGNQPERYFLLEPAQLSIKTQNAQNFTSEHKVVKSVLGTKMMGEFAPKNETASKLKEEEEARIALETMSLDAPTFSGKPPEDL